MIRSQTNYCDTGLRRSSESTQEECCICLTPLSHNAVYLPPPCTCKMPVMHRDCALKALRMNSECPLCRAVVNIPEIKPWIERVRRFLGMADLTFDANFKCSNGVDMEKYLSRFDCPRRMRSINFQHVVTGLYVDFAMWLHPKFVPVSECLTMSKLISIVEHQLERLLTPAEKDCCLLKHREVYKCEAEPGQYTRAKHAYHAFINPNWRLERVGDTTVYELIGS